MVNDKVVIQKINRDGVELFENFNLSSSWSFHNHRKISQEDPHPDVFPFLFDESENFSRRSAGPETEVSFREDKDLWFADDYRVLAGMLIGILFPPSYSPEIFKFKEQPSIPLGASSSHAEPPGHIKVYYNNPSKLSAITFSINKDTFFRFKCIAKYKKSDFPVGDSYSFFNELMGNLRIESDSYISVKREDLENFDELFEESADLDEISEQINTLIEISRSTPSNGNADEVKSKLKKILEDSLSKTGSITTILDSYKNDGVVNELISRLFLYLFL